MIEKDLAILDAVSEFEEEKQDYFKKLFEVEEVDEKRALNIYQGGEINGVTLQIIDEELRTICPEFHKRLRQVLGDFERPTKVNKKKYFNALPQTWRLFFLGSLPAYYAYGWPENRKDLIAQLHNLNRRIRFPRKAHRILEDILKKETHSYWDTYSENRLYFENLSPKKLGKVEGIVVCLYRVY